MRDSSVMLLTVARDLSRFIHCRPGLGADAILAAKQEEGEADRDMVRNLPVTLAWGSSGKRHENGKVACVGRLNSVKLRVFD